MYGTADALRRFDAKIRGDENDREQQKTCDNKQQRARDTLP